MKILEQAIETYYTNTATVEYPACFRDEEEYLEWKEVEEICHTSPRAFVCRDCTSSFQALMVQQKRCHIPEIPVRAILRCKE
jgi:hypothetical protein